MDRARDFLRRNIDWEKTQLKHTQERIKQAKYDLEQMESSEASQVQLIAELEEALEALDDVRD